jgi:hypothetical protein
MVMDSARLGQLFLLPAYISIETLRAVVAFTVLRSGVKVSPTFINFW